MEILKKEDSFNYKIITKKKGNGYAKENTNGKTTYTVKLTFNDDGKLVKEANLTVPDHMHLTEVVSILNNEYVMLNHKCLMVRMEKKDGDLMFFSSMYVISMAGNGEISVIRLIWNLNDLKSENGFT